MQAKDTDETLSAFPRFRKRETAKRIYRKAKEKIRKRDPGVLPKAVQDLLDVVGDEVIVSVEVVRTPVEKYATALMEGVSLGKYTEAMKVAPYDVLFHLSIVLNERYVLQKCEVIKFTDSAGKIIGPSSEAVNVPIPLSVTEEELTYIDLLANTREGMGDEAFTGYSARKNNCQDFVLSVLRYSGLSTATIESFVKQDSEEIFIRMPGYMDAVSNVMTDAAAVADKVIEDARIKLVEEINKENPSDAVAKYLQLLQYASDAERKVEMISEKVSPFLMKMKK